jgi:hypothetical protein
VALFRRSRTDASTTAVPEFWQWWATLGAAACAAALAAGRTADVVSPLGAAVTRLHRELSWELAPGTTSEHVLVVTAAGDPRLRALARRWLRAAPPADAVWEYADTRPAERDLTWALQVEGAEVDAAGAVLACHLDEERACVDVVLHHPRYAALPADLRDQVTFLLLDHALGEQAVETWIGAVSSSAQRPDGALTDLAGLAATLEVLAERHRDGAGSWTLLEAELPSGQVLLAAAQVPLRAAVAPHLDQHVRVELPYAGRTGSALPAEESLAALRAVEDHVVAGLRGDGRLVAHETSGGLRTLHMYVDSTTGAAGRVRAVAEAWPEGRARTSVTADPGWSAVAHLRA